MKNDSDAARVAAQFDQYTRHVAKSFKRQLEIARASQDEDAIIKGQIKLGVLRAARGMFAGSYRAALGEKPEGDWQDV